ncbi:MAG TPA: hypothetical protein VFC92_06045 [Bacteroidales bacterium]|nr:hypothetical protein [Bacteroidales bacterium]
MRFHAAAFLLLFLPLLLPAQPADSLFIASARELSEVMYSDTADSVKLQHNQELEQLVVDFLSTPFFPSFSFDSLAFIKHLAPDDGSFALITWVVPLSNHLWQYGGMIRKKVAKEKDTLFRLQPILWQPSADSSYSYTQWPGAVYRNIISRSPKGNPFYTLTGWHGEAEGLGGRVIEALWFDSAGAPRFGLPVFVMKDGSQQQRAFFSFTNQVPFHLAYELQLLPGEKRKRDQMIVFNRLGGNSSQLGQMFRGAVPRYDIFDAFVYLAGKWVFHQDIDARSDTRHLPKFDPPEQGLGNPKK